VTGRQGRRREQLPDEKKEKRGYWKLKEEALDNAVWRTSFGRSYGLVVRETIEWMNEQKGLSAPIKYRLHQSRRGLYI
jgi:hypothetical protein